MLKRLALVMMGSYFATTIVAAIVVADFATVVLPWIWSGGEE